MWLSFSYNCSFYFIHLVNTLHLLFSAYEEYNDNPCTVFVGIHLNICSPARSQGKGLEMILFWCKKILKVVHHHSTFTSVTFVDEFALLFPFKFKVGLLPTKKICFICFWWKPFKNDEKCFLFHLKSSFHSQYIRILVLTFWSCRENGLIRKIKLISKFMTSQLG